jgi:Sulfotransferase family
MGERLQRENLMAEATAQTGLDDFGDIPFEEPLDVLLESLERDARVDGERRAGARATIVGLLVKRLRLVDDRKKFPAIADEVITAPLFIVGLPRTGSTHLHALMAEAEGIRTPRFWEMTMPSPPPERETFTTDPRIAQVQAIVDQMPPELQARHPIAPMRPEQCNMLNDWSFIHQALLAFYEVHGYRDWLFNADYRPAFEAHRRTLQHLQWRNPGHWVLKYPKHLMALETLLETYPDANLVWTHRDPAVVVPSVASFTGFYRASNTPDFDPKRFGREWASLEELVLHRGLAFRDRMGDADKRVYDLHYRDLMADQVGTVGRILEHFGMPFGDESAHRVQAFVDQNPQTKHGVHKYSPEDFGLTAERLRERFAFYTDRFGVEQERKGGS